jgi:hypothetical protein
MKLILKYLFLIAVLIFPTIDHAGQMVSEPNEFWIEWDSPEGVKRLENSKTKSHVNKLLRYYESQIRLTYCGVATAVIALNALSIPAPESKILGQFRLFNQEEFFDGPISQILDTEKAKTSGISLNDMFAIMNSYPLDITEYKALDLSVEDIREAMIAGLEDPEKVVIALYHRSEIKQIGSGHWSPVAAYDHVSDSFLILDVARFKYPPVWVDAEAFIKAMHTQDGKDNSRGFLVLDPQPYRESTDIDEHDSSTHN